MTPLALNMTDAGKLAGVSRWTIQAWIRSGLPYIPSGRKHKMILASALESWLKSRQVVAKGVRS
jgi:predicted site-specific integrase-resolvase